MSGGSCDEAFFSEVSTASSFRAGFIAADGCIYKNRVKIAIGEKDEEYLVAFCRDLGYQNKIYRRSPSITRDRFGVPHITRPTLSIDVESGRMVNDLLRNFRITSRKSLTLTPPTGLDSACELAFLAGYIDGDGSITINRFAESRGNARPYIIHIVGTREVLEWAKSITTRIHHRVHSNPSSVCHYGKNNYCQYFLYGNAAHSLAAAVRFLGLNVMERKWSKIIIDDDYVSMRGKMPGSHAHGKNQHNVLSRGRHGEISAAA